MYTVGEPPNNDSDLFPAWSAVESASGVEDISQDNAIGAIANELGISKQAATNKFNSLVRAGHLRESGPSDRGEAESGFEGLGLKPGDW